MSRNRLGLAAVAVLLAGSACGVEGGTRDASRGGNVWPTPTLTYISVTETCERGTVPITDEASRQALRAWAEDFNRRLEVDGMRSPAVRNAAGRIALLFYVSPEGQPLVAEADGANREMLDDLVAERQEALRKACAEPYGPLG